MLMYGYIHQIKHLNFQCNNSVYLHHRYRKSEQLKDLTILYTDSKEKETLIIDFGADIKYAHPIIYGKFKEATE